MDIEIGNTLSELEHVQDVAKDFLDRQGLDGETAFNVLFALEEVVSNIILHGQKDIPLRIQVHLEQNDSCIELQICDNGPGFDPLLQPAPDTGLPLDERPIGGLGIFLTRQLASRIDYQRIKHRNQFSLSFQLPQDCGAGPAA